MAVTVESIGVKVLNLDSGFQLVLKNVFYVPSFRRNLIFISALDKIGYSLHFGNSKVDLLLNSKIIGHSVLCDGLYRLSLSHSDVYASFHVEHSVSKRPRIIEKSVLLWHKRLGHISKERIERL